MISVVAILALLGVICSSILKDKVQSCCVSVLLASIFLVSFIMFFSSTTIIANSILLIITYSDVDERISAIEQENSEIEDCIYSVIEYYNEHENNHLEIEKKDIMADVSLFPELEIVLKEKIEHYNTNNEEINQLKEKKGQIPKAKWALYFGS